MADSDPRLALSRSDVEECISSCDRCPLHRVGGGGVPLRGDGSSGIAVVGEAPGNVEDQERRPFVGPSGDELMSWLSIAGFAAPTIAYMNAVSCFPNRTPTGNEVSTCAVNLHMQLSITKPSLLLLLGGIAVSSWWSNMRVGEIRGHYWQAPVNGLPYKPVAMATWHPAAVLRNTALREEALTDVMLLRSFVDGDYDPDDDKGCVKCGVRDRLVYIGPEEHVVSGAEYGVPFCEKHWAFRTGTGGKGRPAVSKKATPKRGPKPKTEKMF